MAISEVECFMVECDHCKDMFENSEGFSIFVDQGSAKEECRDADWLIENNKCYCPNCYDYDENDNIIIKTKKNE